MFRVAEFFPVSEREFIMDYMERGKTKDQAISGYGSVKVPLRATSGSAGYDFVTPFGFELKPGQSIEIPTGVRVKIEEGWVLMIFPRSGLGFKYHTVLANTVGIIDSDYYYAKNEGHIIIKLINASPDGKTLELKTGDRFAQGVFTQFGITRYDNCQEKREGGLGSTVRI